MVDFSDASLWTLATVAVAVGCAIPITAIILEHQRRTRQAEMDFQLKRDLVAQGKSSEEIQKILDLSSESTRN